MILLADDDRTLVSHLLEKLQSSGLTARWCKNEKECVEALSSSEKLELIVVDIMMPLIPLTKEEIASFDFGTSNTLESSSSTGMRLIRDIRGGKYPSARRADIIIYSIVEKEEYKREAEELGIPYCIKSERNPNAVVAMILERIGKS